MRKQGFVLRMATGSLAGSLLALGLAACNKAPTTVKQEAPRPVRTVTIGQGTEAAASLTSINLPGEIRPRIESRLGFRVAGKLMQRLVNVGEPVRAGQVLARLDPQDAAPALTNALAQLEGARTEVKIAQIELKRIQELVEKNFVSKAQLDRQQATADAAHARLNSAEAVLKQARNSVEFQTLVADVDGVVTGVEAEVGQVVAAGTPVYRVARKGEKELLINVPETELKAARAVELWQVDLPALGRQVQGKFRELTPVADAASRTYAIRITLIGDLNGVEMGMTANARAARILPVSGAPGQSAAVTTPAAATAAGTATAGSGPSGNVLALPLGAIFSKDNQPGVWTVSDKGVVALTRVDVVGMTEEQVYVRSGLVRGQKVVTAGANLLSPGQTVRLESK